MNESEKKGNYDSALSIKDLPPRHIRECWCSFLRKTWLSVPGMDRFGVQIPVMIPEKLKQFIIIPGGTGEGSSSSSTVPLNSGSIRVLGNAGKYASEEEFILKVALDAVSSTLVDIIFNNRLEYYKDRIIIRTAATNEGMEGMEEIETITIKVPDADGKYICVCVCPLCG